MFRKPRRCRLPVSANVALTIAGTLNSTANTTFTVGFFSNPSGTSAGETFVGVDHGHHGQYGLVTLTHLCCHVLAPGQVIMSCTATRPLGEDLGVLK